MFEVIRVKGEECPLSNFYQCTIRIPFLKFIAEEFSSVEQAYQAAKADFLCDCESKNLILNTHDAREIKSLSHRMDDHPRKAEFDEGRGYFMSVLLEYKLCQVMILLFSYILNCSLCYSLKRLNRKIKIIEKKIKINKRNIKNNIKNIFNLKKNSVLLLY